MTSAGAESGVLVWKVEGIAERVGRGSFSTANRSRTDNYAPMRTGAPGFFKAFNLKTELRVYG